MPIPRERALKRYKFSIKFPWKLFFFIFLLLYKTSPLSAQDFDSLVEGYDPNTEISIKGEIVQLNIPERGIVTFNIFLKGKAYRVFLCPSWYYQELNPDILLNDIVEIKGAKIYTPRHGIVFVVKSLRVVRTGKEYIFRREDFSPLWKGRGKGRPFR